MSAEELRDKVIKHIETHRDLYESSMVDPDIFMGRLKKKNEWADHIFVQALSRILKINIFIVQSNGQQPIILRRANARITIYLGFEVGVHYQSLYPRSEFNETTIKLLLESTIEDKIPIHDEIVEIPREDDRPKQSLSTNQQGLRSQYPKQCLYGDNANSQSVISLEKEDTESIEEITQKSSPGDDDNQKRSYKK